MRKHNIPTNRYDKTNDKTFQMIQVFKFTYCESVAVRSFLQHLSSKQLILRLLVAVSR